MADTPTTESSALDVLAKTGTTAKPGIVNSSILADMQKLYDQKLAEKNYFMQDLADASAWWSGGAAGPSAGLAQRAQTRALQSKQLEDLQAQLSQGKVNIAQLGEANTSMSEPKAGISGLPTGGAQAPAGAPAGEYTIRGVPVPVHVYKAYQAHLKQGNLAKANEVFDSYTKEETKFLTAPGTYKQEDYFDKNIGQMDRRTPMEVRGGTAPMVTAPTAASRAPVPTQAVAGPQDAVQAGVPVISGYRDEAKQGQLYTASQQPGYKGPPVAKPGESLHQTGEAIDVADFKKLKPEQLKWLRENGYQQTLPDTDPNHFVKIGTPRITDAPAATQMSATAPTQMPTTAPAPTQMLASTTAKPQSYSDYLVNQASKKEYTEKSSAASGEAAGKRRAAFESAAVDAGKDLQTTNSMLNIMDNNPGAVGYSFKNSGVGATIEGVKLLTGKDIEPFARRLTLSKEDVEAGNKFDALAQKNSLKFRQDVFKGTGAVSDFETKLAERASGLSRDNSIETNRFFAILAAESYRTVNKLGVEWDKYKKTNPGADFAQFEQSDAWKKATAERSERLEKLLPDLARSDLSFGEKAPPKGADSKELEGWKQRYGTSREK